MGVRIHRSDQKVCPLDDQPLKQAHLAMREPSVFVHQDGTIHEDGLAAMTREDWDARQRHTPQDRGQR